MVWRRVVHGSRRVIWCLCRPRTRGVKVMLFNQDGEDALIRNSYGRSDLFVLPGGGVRPFEAPAKAAVREVREELGCAVTDLSLVSVHRSTSEGKRDTISLFRGIASGAVTADGHEVVEAGFFGLDSLPSGVSPATLRRVDEYRGLRLSDTSW